MGVEYIFIKFLLIPLLVGLAMIGFAIYAKANELLRPGRLILYVLVQAVVFTIPALFGFLTYEFIPYGLIAVQVTFFGIGILCVWFTESASFESIGFDNKKGQIFLAILTSLVLGTWGCFLLFEFLSSLGYSLWVALTSLWILLPVFFHWGKNAYLEIPPVYYSVFDPLETGQFDNQVWEKADFLRMQNISLRIKQEAKDREFSAYPVKAPGEVPVAQWFVRYVKDQRVKFPNAPIEMEANGEPYCWIFYTNRFFIFNRPLSPEKTFENYRIRNNAVIYARRVDKEETMV